MSTATISLLSAGAIEPGLVAAVDAYNKRGAGVANITWSTAPVIRRRLDNNEVHDVVIAPDAAIDDFARQHKVAGDERLYVGRVGIGIVTRVDVVTPDLSNVDAVEKAVLDAESVVFNRASSGLHVEALLKNRGISDSIQHKTKRFDDGPAMMAHLITGKGQEIAFGAIIEILMFTGKGLKLAAPLPEEIQHWTRYDAAPMTAARNAVGARDFMRYLATPQVRGLFAAHGIE